MADNGNNIPVIIESSPVQTDEELKTNSRMILGYLSAKYESDADITVTISFKRDNDMEWENSDPITLSKDEKRYKGQLPLGLSVIDFYVIAELNPTEDFWISSLKVHIKTSSCGKVRLRKEPIMALDNDKAQLVWNKLYGTDTTVDNPYTNYQNAFNYNDISSNLNSIYSNEEADINRSTNEDIAGQQSNAAQSMASQEITGGSILTDTQKGIASKANKQKYNALSTLGTSQANSTMNLQNSFNQNKLDVTKAGVGVDQQNVQNQLQQGNALSGFLNSQEQLGLEQQNQPGTWEDIFSGLQQGLSIPTGKDKNVLSSLVGLF